MPIAPAPASRLGAPKTRRQQWRNLGGDCLLLALLAGIAVCLGLVRNRWRVQPLSLVYASPSERLQQSVARLDAARATSPAKPPIRAALPPVQMIDLARFHDLVDARAVVLDARSPLFFRAGHVPGARALSREAFETDYARQRAFLETHRQGPLVVYCSGDACVDSRLVAAALQKLGYAHVLVFEGGWEEWQRAGLPEERG